MATGVYRTADQIQREAEQKRKEEERLRQQLAGVNWGALAQMGQTPQGGRGTAVNTVGQPGGYRPGTTTSGYTPSNVQGGRGTAINTVGQPRMPFNPTTFTNLFGSERPPGSFWEDSGLVLDVGGNLRLNTPSAGGGGDGDVTVGDVTVGDGTGGSGTGGSGGGSAGGGAGGGSGGGAGGTTPVDTTVSDLLAALAESTALAREQITGAGTTLAEQLAATDPMAQFQWNPASVNIPQATLANYVQAIGGSPNEVQATQQLGQELLNAFMGDVGQVSQGATTAAQNWRQRQQDVGAQLTADALRQLAFNEQAQKMGIQRSEADRARALENQALQLLLQYATAKSGNGSLNVTAPTLPFNTVNIPGQGSITINPSTLAGLGL